MSETVVISERFIIFDRCNDVATLIELGSAMSTNWVRTNLRNFESDVWGTTCITNLGKQFVAWLNEENIMSARGIDIPYVVQ